MQIRDVDLHVVDQGSGGSPLLLVHGFTGSDVDWADVQPALAAHRRVVSYTQRGHGDSTNTGDPASYTFDALVDDLAVFVDALDLAPLHLLGHSMGGVVALRYALEHPERTTSLVLMDTFAEPAAPSATGDWMTAMIEQVRADGMEVLVDLMRQFTPADASPEKVARGEHKIRNMDPDAFLVLGGELRTYPSMLDRLGELTMPVTVVVGANDTNLLEPAHVMTERIPGAVLEVIADAGHSPQEDRPDEWLRVIEAHLARAG